MLFISSKAFRLRKVTVKPFLEKVFSGLKAAQDVMKKAREKAKIFQILGCRIIMIIFHLLAFRVS